MICRRRGYLQTKGPKTGAPRSDNRTRFHPHQPDGSHLRRTTKIEGIRKVIYEAIAPLDVSCAQTYCGKICRITCSPYKQHNGVAREGRNGAAHTGLSIRMWGPAATGTKRQKLGHIKAMRLDNISTSKSPTRRRSAPLNLSCTQVTATRSAGNHAALTSITKTLRVKNERCDSYRRINWGWGPAVMETKGLN